MSGRKKGLRVERTGFGDTRRIVRGNGEIVGLAIQLSNGSWGAFDTDAGRRLSFDFFGSPTGVRKWFEDTDDGHR
jgi:hypothetical protein